MAYMHCPRCKKVELKITKIKEIEVDYCPECYGLWLDRGELNNIIERLKSKSSKHSNPVKSNTASETNDLSKVKKQKDGSFIEDVVDFFEDFADDFGGFDWE